MADKPSRALVLFGDGLARFIDPSPIHLHSLASKGFCGFLTLPNSPSSGQSFSFVHFELLITPDELTEFSIPNSVSPPFSNESISDEKVWIWMILQQLCHQQIIKFNCKVSHFTISLGFQDTSLCSFALQKPDYNRINMPANDQNCSDTFKSDLVIEQCRQCLELPHLGKKKLQESYYKLQQRKFQRCLSKPY